MVFGTISDYTGNSDRQYVDLARQAMALVDFTVFVGPRASKSLKALRPEDDPARLRAFYSPEHARTFLRDVLRPGDLVLLKGGSDRDYLGNVVPRVGEETADTVAAVPASNVVQAIVGLGNPGSKFENTPHNLGYDVIERLAQSIGVEWSDEPDALVARVLCEGRVVHLVKAKSHMNSTGPVLAQVAARMGIHASSWLIVHDDADLALGVVRMRESGSDGGHRGVRSVLEAFNTDDVRRLKVGGRRVNASTELRVRVLTPFEPGEREVVDRACLQAVERLKALLSLVLLPPSS